MCHGTAPEHRKQKLEKRRHQGAHTELPPGLSQIWANIVSYYTGSIADGADRRNLRKLHFFNQQKQVKC